MKDDLAIFDIDLNRLEEECANHSSIVYKYTKEYELVKIELEEAIMGREEIEAGISSLIRKAPKKYGLDPAKITETAIKKTVILRPKYKVVIKVIKDIQYKLALLKATVRTLDHKKSMLEKEVQLHGQGYFAKPYVPSGNMKEAVDYEEKKAARKRSKKRKRKESEEYQDEYLKGMMKKRRGVDK